MLRIDAKCHQKQLDRRRQCADLPRFWPAAVPVSGVPASVPQPVHPHQLPHLKEFESLCLPGESYETKLRWFLAKFEYTLGPNSAEPVMALLDWIWQGYSGDPPDLGDGGGIIKPPKLFKRLKPSTESSEKYEALEE